MYTKMMTYILNLQVSNAMVSLQNKCPKNAFAFKNPTQGLLLMMQKLEKPTSMQTYQTLALLGAIVRLNFLFSSVSSITGNIPLSLRFPKNSFP